MSSAGKRSRSAAADDVDKMFASVEQGVAKRCKVIEKKAADFKQEMEDLFLVLMMKIPKQIQNMPMAGLEDELGLGKGAKKGSADENDANMAPPPTVLRSTRNRGRTGGDAAQKKATSQAKDSAKSVAATPSRRATRQSARFGAGAGEPETPMFDPRLPETPAMGRARRGQTIIGQASDEGIAVQLEDGTLYDGKSSAVNMDEQQKEQLKATLEATQAEVARMLAELGS